jgi:hypothetical protein
MGKVDKLGMVDKMNMVFNGNMMDIIDMVNMQSFGYLKLLIDTLVPIYLRWLLLIPFGKYLPPLTLIHLIHPDSPQLAFDGPDRPCLALIQCD